MGRHKKEISPSEMKKAGEYAFNGCKDDTIEGLMGWSDEFIKHRPDISAFILKKRQERNNALRSAQTKLAIHGKDTAMLCFLGKNELGQTDKIETKINGGETPLLVVIGRSTDAGKTNPNNPA